jgi:hypothetical protein
LVLLTKGNNVGQTVALLTIKAPPVVLGADHLSSGNAGQTFTSVIPDGDAPVCVEDKGWNNKVLHQTHCEVV